MRTGHIFKFDISSSAYALCSETNATFVVHVCLAPHDYDSVPNVEHRPRHPSPLSEFFWQDRLDLPIYGPDRSHLPARLRAATDGMVVHLHHLYC